MRRAAIQTLRAVRRPKYRSVLSNGHHALRPRSYSNRRERPEASLSSMQLRNFGVAALSTAVATGAYYAYRGTQGPNNAPNASGAVSYSTAAANGYSSPSAASPEEAAQATRRALVVEEGQIYSGNIVGDGPLSKETDDYGRKVLEMLTPEQATQKLRRSEESWIVGRGKGVVRYDIVQSSSNDPIEDDHAEKILQVPQTVAATDDASPSSDWMFWGVFDGHSGWTTSAKLRQVLISFVARELNSTYKAALADPKLTFPTPESIDRAIQQGFIKLDHEIVHDSVAKVTKAQSKRVAAELLAPALSGSCALLSFYDSRSKEFRVACTGDSRAVLGRRGPSGKWTATALSIDQTGDTEEEVARMRREHPNEPRVIANGRVLGGLQPTRAFGDAVYKWGLETQQKLKEAYFGRTPSKLLATPPYVTAEPVVTTTKVQPENGDFVVMATDGLWEMLTNEEVIGLVGQWLETEAKAKTGGSGQGWLQSWFSGQKTLPVEMNGDDDVTGQRAPIRQQQWGIKEKNDRFVVKDRNVATHLIRNALGGKDEDQLCALLTLPSPYSRRYRDDLTVEVIFFGEGENTGNVTLNLEASAAGSDAKPKL